MKNNQINVKRISAVFFILVFLFVLCGCEKKEENLGAAYSIYYLNSNDNSIVAYEINTENDNITAMTAEFLDMLKESPDVAKYHSVLDDTVGYNGYVFSDGQLTIDFDSKVLQLPLVKQILIRAALARTLTQLAGVDTLSLTVAGSPMLDVAGVPIGPISGDMFIDNAGAQINPDEKTTLTLYFASEDGNSLVKVNRKVTYNSNISMDKLIIEQLIKGPENDEEGLAVFDPNIKTISVTSQDGTCYVNFNEYFLSPPPNISTDAAIYAIVNSLVEIGSVNKVQFLVNGESAHMLREKEDLSTPFSRNLDIID